MICPKYRMTNGMPQFMHQNRNEHDADPDQQLHAGVGVHFAVAAPGIGPEDQRGEPEQRMHADRNAGDLKVEIVGRAWWFEGKHRAWLSECEGPWPVEPYGTAQAPDESPAGHRNSKSSAAVRVHRLRRRASVPLA